MSGVNNRIRYFDLLRVICTAFIIYYHMLVELWVDGISPSEKVSVFYSNPNMSLATLGVGVFFMLSGAGLTISSKSEFSIKEFYKKRFITVLVPFYIANLVYYIVELFISDKNWFRDIANWKIIYTALGIDEWLKMHEVDVVSTSIGEWFLGALIIIYLLYPVFRYLMNKYPYLFFTLAASIYIAWIYNCRMQTPPANMTVIAKAFEFIIGMYIGKYMKTFPKKLMPVVVPVFVFFATNQWPLGINSALTTTLTAFVFFASLSYLEPMLAKHECKGLTLLSGFTYYCFLTHHMVIYIITPMMKPHLDGKFSMLGMFALEIVLMIVFALIVKALTNLLIKGASRLTRQN